MATAARPEGPFSDIGQPLLCGQGFVNNDPMAYDDPASGRRLLYWGSGFEPIRVRELEPDRISFAQGSTSVDLVDVVKTDDPANYRRLVEGAWVLRREDGQGNWRIFHHAVDSRKTRTKPSDDVNSRRILFIGYLVWRDDWPEVAR